MRHNTLTSDVNPVFVGCNKTFKKKYIYRDTVPLIGHLPSPPTFLLVPTFNLFIVRYIPENIFFLYHKSLERPSKGVVEVIWERNTFHLFDNRGSPYTYCYWGFPADFAICKLSPHILYTEKKLSQAPRLMAHMFRKFEGT